MMSVPITEDKPMKKTKFTKGPWAVNPFRAQVDSMPDMIPVCQLLWPTDLRTEVVTEANAALISAAPDLYEALKGFLAIVSDSRGVDGYHLNGSIAEWDEFDEINRAFAAMAKARGES